VPFPSTCTPYTLYTRHPTPCTIRPTPYTLHPTPFMHPIPCTLHPACYTLRLTPATPHPTPCTLNRRRCAEMGGCTDTLAGGDPAARRARRTRRRPPCPCSPRRVSAARPTRQCPRGGDAARHAVSRGTAPAHVPRGGSGLSPLDPRRARPRRGADRGGGVDVAARGGAQRARTRRGHHPPGLKRKENHIQTFLAMKFTTQHVVYRGCKRIHVLNLIFKKTSI